MIPSVNDELSITPTGCSELWSERDEQQGEKSEAGDEGAGDLKAGDLRSESMGTEESSGWGTGSAKTWGVRGRAKRAGDLTKVGR